MKRWNRRHRLLFSLRVGLILAGGMLLFGAGQEVVVQPPVVVDHSGETWQFEQVRGVSTTEVGVYGYTDASEHCGVFGHSPAGIGVKGASNGTDGVQGWTSAPNASGVLGYSDVAAGVSGCSSGNDGLVGISISPNPDHAALRARNEGSGPAIVCEGDLIVTGAIQGGGIAQLLDAVVEDIAELETNLDAVQTELETTLDQLLYEIQGDVFVIDDIARLEAKVDGLEVPFENIKARIAANGGAIGQNLQHIWTLYHLVNYDRATNNRVEEKLNQLLGALGVVDLPQLRFRP